MASLDVDGQLVLIDPAGERLAVCTTIGYCVSVFDVASGKALWHSSHLGGRMGSPMALLMGAEILVGDGGRFLWSPATGETRLRGLEIPGVIFVGARDALLTSSLNAIELLDGTTGRRRWRFDGGDGPTGPIEHPSGWVGGAPGSPGANLDPWCFDPRRIRAAFSGMVLLPAPTRGPGWRLLVPRTDYLALARAAKTYFTQGPLRVGMPVPEIKGLGFAGNPMRLSDFLGKVAVLEFSRRSSPLSRGRTAAAEALLEKYATAPLAWVGVLSDTKESYVESTSEGDASWPSFHDGGTTRGLISTDWGVTSWPTIFVIDHDGILRYRGGSSTLLESAVRTILRDMGSPPHHSPR